MRLRVQWLLEPGHVTSIPAIVASSTPTFPHLALGEGRSGDRSHREHPAPLWERRLRRDFEATDVQYPQIYQTAPFPSIR